jgi:ArsR family transcriptional regulator
MMHDLIRTVKALSDETRIRMLVILSERECCVCEVMQALDISQTRSSRNLRILLDTGFLKLREESLWVIYSLDKEGMPQWQSTIATTVINTLKNNQVALADIARLKNAKRVGHGCPTANTDNTDTVLEHVTEISR